MSSLLFLFQLSGFVLLVHWAYINDEARPSDASKGFLRMRGSGVAAPAEPSKAAPGWRRAKARAKQAAPTGKPERAAPAWRQPLR